MTHVLIIVSWLGVANGAVIATQEFTSAERCDAARLVATKSNSGSTRCVRLMHTAQYVRRYSNRRHAVRRVSVAPLLFQVSSSIVKVTSAQIVLNPSKSVLRLSRE